MQHALSLYIGQWQGLAHDIQRYRMARKLEQLLPDPLGSNQCDHLTVASTQFYSTQTLQQEPSSDISLIFSEIIEQIMVSTQTLFAQ